MKTFRLLSFLVALVALVSVPACPSLKNGAGAIAADGQKIAIDCLQKTVADQVPSVLGDINKILVDGSRSVDAKQVAIDQLQSAGVAALACAARQALEDLTRSHLFNEANPEILTNRDTMRGYLAQKSFKFADGFTVSADAGAE